MNFFKYITREWIELVGIGILVLYIWQGLEMIFLREIRPNIVDTIISIPITLLLHYEYKKHIRNYDIDSN